MKYSLPFVVSRLLNIMLHGFQKSLEPLRQGLQRKSLPDCTGQKRRLTCSAKDCSGKPGPKGTPSA